MPSTDAAVTDEAMSPTRNQQPVPSGERRTRYPKVPRDPHDDYTEEMAARRRAFATEQSGGSDLSHVARYSFDPHAVPGNIENFMGVAQVPIGLAGPLVVDGEHVRGAVYVPLATSEGTLVASYNRGMRLLSESGGVKTTVVESSMQRAPCFVLKDAREARDFGRWIDESFSTLKKVAESTTRAGKLTDIGQYQVGAMRYLRFNYTTGDAAGQNLTGKATYAACEWIKKNYPGKLQHYQLSGGIDTDKKHSHINKLLTRGKRVVAEAVLRKDLMKEIMGVDTADLFRARLISTTGAMLAGAANNSVHPANGLAALFIATGQDVANVAESHSAITHVQLHPNGDYYYSITLTSLIVATYGGGTGLPTQRQCLELMGCYGSGKADRFAELCAGVVLAGELSLGAAAVIGSDWVESHDRLGRNRR